MDAITLRRAGPADAEAVAALAYETFRQTFLEGFAVPYPADDLAGFVAATYAPAVCASQLADPDRATWLAEEGGVALGYASAGPCTLPHPEAEPQHIELKRLYVLGSAQGRGLGRRLMDAALAWMQTHKAGPLWIGVWSGNLKAQGFYARYGFRKAGEYAFPVGRWWDDEFILRRG